MYTIINYFMKISSWMTDIFQQIKLDKATKNIWSFILNII